MFYPMNIPSPIEMKLLALVANQEMSGRDVAKRYVEETGRNISYGTLYTTFRRLKENGFIKVRDGEDEDGRIRYFRIDATGRHALAQAREYYSGLATFGNLKVATLCN